jgi:disulfide bond formation protein DsbB/cytochrome c5
VYTHGVTQRFNVHPLLYLALLAAWLATAGSLYMSEVLGWIPCQWCWYQRIAMYPLSLLLLAGIARRDRAIPGYALLLAVPGWLASMWHIGIQKVPEITLRYVCRDGVPCSSDSLFELGLTPRWMTVPMLSFAAFAIIVVCCAVALIRKPQPVAEDAIEGLPPAAFAGAVALTVTLLYAVATYIAPKPVVENPLAPVPALPTGSDATGASAAAFKQYCQVCHSPQTPRGFAKIRPDFVRTNDQAALAAFIKKGRTADSPDSVSKAPMPALGGYPFLTDQQVAGLAQYLIDTAR